MATCIFASSQTLGSVGRSFRSWLVPLVRRELVFWEDLGAQAALVDLELLEVWVLRVQPAVPALLVLSEVSA